MTTTSETIETHSPEPVDQEPVPSAPGDPSSASAGDGPSPAENVTDVAASALSMTGNAAENGPLAIAPKTIPRRRAAAGPTPKRIGPPSPAKISAASAGLASQPSWPVGFSGPYEKRYAEWAERETGLTAREVFRPASETNTGTNIAPDIDAPEDNDKNFRLGRCQLGEIITEWRDRPALASKRHAFKGKVEVFLLKAHGRTWPEAVLSAWSRRARK